MKIAFLVNHFSIRGTEVAIFDYAHYNEKILNNDSIIVVSKDFKNKQDYNGRLIHNEQVYQKFNERFHIIEYNDRSHLNEIVKTENVNIFYNLKSGENDGFIVEGVKNVNHCVFTYDSIHAHGDIYIPISSTIVSCNIRDCIPVVPHIVTKYQVSITDDLRRELNIPIDAIVFGRHGGYETFNIDFVKETIRRIVREKENIYFIFMNTENFVNDSELNNRVFFFPESTDSNFKTKFINTCDAMIHARSEGESFGLSIAEFSVLDKGIVTFYNENQNSKFVHNNHVDILGNNGIYYKNEDELYNIFISSTKESLIKNDCYSSKFSPENVMSLFNQHIIRDIHSVYNFTTEVVFDDLKWTYFSNDSLGKTLETEIGWEPHVFKTIKMLLHSSSNVFIDVGSNIGYHAIRASKCKNTSVIAIEPHTDVFRLLNLNVKQNNLTNVTLVNKLISTRNSGTLQYLSFLDSNYGDLSSFVDNGFQINSCSLNDILVSKRSCELDKSFNSENVVLKIDVSGSELDVLKNSVEFIETHRPYIILPLESHVCQRYGYTCRSIKNLLFALKYQLVEIHSDYPCDHLCFPLERKEEFQVLFGKYIKPTIENKINNNLSLGVTTSIVYPSRLLTTKPQPITVKLITNWATNEEITKLWSRMSKESERGKWNNIELTTDKLADYYVIINQPHFQEQASKNKHHGDCFFEPEKTIVFRMEPDSVTSDRWDQWYKNVDSKFTSSKTCLTRNDFLYFLDLNTFRNNSEWHLGATYTELINSDLSKFKNKENKISSVVSSLYEMEGHKKRIDFIKYLQQYDSSLVDVFGKSNNHNLKNHYGELPSHNKNVGIIPYKYTFIAENCDIENYFTEKIIDAILGESLCFYWGCSNLENFIDSRAFVRLNLDDFESSKQVVLSAIKCNLYEQRLSFIKTEKLKILNRYNFFPRLEGLISLSKIDIVVVNLDRRTDRWNSTFNACRRSWGKENPPIERFSAVDGKKISSFPYEFRGFEKFARRKPKMGEIGCALSHLKIWKQVMERNKDTLILEDDVWFEDNFVDSLAMVYNEMKTRQYSTTSKSSQIDLLFVGYHVNQDYISHKNINKKEVEKKGLYVFENSLDNNNLTIDMTPNEPIFCESHTFGIHGGGTFGYIITPQGAKRLIERIENTGFLWPVDYQMLLNTFNSELKNKENTYFGTINSSCVMKRLVFSEAYDPKTNTGDSDVQIENSKK